MSVSVCLSVHAPKISPEPHARSLPIFVHAAYVRGSVLLWHVYTTGRIAYRREGVLFPIENALSAGKRGWECTARAKYAMYDCLVLAWRNVEDHHRSRSSIRQTRSDMLETLQRGCTNRKCYFRWPWVIFKVNSPTERKPLKCTLCRGGGFILPSSARSVIW